MPCRCPTFSQVHVTYVRAWLVLSDLSFVGNTCRQVSLEQEAAEEERAKAEALSQEKMSLADELQQHLVSFDLSRTPASEGTFFRRFCRLVS